MDAAELPFRPRDRAAYLPAADSLVLADLHLGRSESAAVGLPVSNSVVERLADLLAWCDPSTVVLAGDVVHSFTRVTRGVAESFGRLRERVGRADLLVVAGNHDACLDALCDSVDAHRLVDGSVVCHGHEAPDERADRYVVGHDHPAIVIEGKRRPCYLYGEGVYRGADVVALPAFDPLARGTAVNRLRRDDPASPFLADVRAFSPVVWDDAAGETYVFPKLSSSGPFL